MSAHRRRRSRGDATLRRRALSAPGRRRVYSSRHTSYRLLPVIFGLALLGIGAIAGPAVVGDGWHPGVGADRDRITLASLPDDAPEQGMVYEGLTPAGADSLCAGAYELDPETCTHGPEAAPAGL
ncbi:MAG TPA: hypothetical protein VFR35_10720, partial [Actinoplanes sp.]|nr:hypothetical protein [Actinoplanes sp.]